MSTSGSAMAAARIAELLDRRRRGRPRATSAERRPSSAARPSSCENAAPKTSVTTRVRAAAGAVGIGERAAQVRRVADDPRRGEELAGGVEVDAVGGVQRRSSSPRGPGWSRCPLLRSLLRLFELGEEAVDDRLRAVVFGERLADDATGEVEGESAHLAAQRDERRLTLCLDLSLGVRGDARGLGLRGLLGLGDDLRAVGACLVADRSGLATCFGELRGVLLERGGGLGLRLFGALDAALDRVARVRRATCSWPEGSSRRRTPAR